MRILQPSGRADLDHRAFFLSGNPPHTALVAAAQDGRYSVVDLSTGDVRPCCYPSNTRDISFDSNGSRLAFVDADAGSLVVTNLRGGRLAEFEPPAVDGAAPACDEPGFGACRFAEGGQYLWAAGSNGVGQKCDIRLFDCATWSLIKRRTLRDPYGGSHFSFHETSRKHVVGLWQAAGQDGQQMYWLKRTRTGCSCVTASRLKNTTPPVFSPGGEHFLVVDEQDALCKYGFPSNRRLGRLLGGDDDDDQYFEPWVAHLDEREALVASSNVRIHVLDTIRMEIVEEVAVLGHESKPIGEYYPTLRHEKGQATDISYFARIGDAIFFVYRRDRHKVSADWKDSLLWLRLPTSAAL